MQRVRWFHLHLVGGTETLRAWQLARNTRSHTPMQDMIVPVVPLQQDQRADFCWVGNNGTSYVSLIYPRNNTETVLALLPEEIVLNVMLRDGVEAYTEL